MRRYFKKESTPFDRANLKAQLMDFSKALMSMVLSYAMENMASFLAFLWHLRNLWQWHQALIIPLAGGWVWG